MITSNDIIFIHRGDDMQFDFIINRGTTTCPKYYSLTAGDYLLFSVCEPNQPFEYGIIRKIYTSADNVGEDDGETILPVAIKISGSDTINLVPGTYYYSIKLCQGRLGDSTTETVLSRKKFVILD